MGLEVSLWEGETVAVLCTFYTCFLTAPGPISGTKTAFVSQFWGMARAGADGMGEDRSLGRPFSGACGSAAS